MSALIVAKAPDARAMIEKLVPFQAFIGVGLLAVSVLQFLRLGPGNIIKSISHVPLVGLTWLAGCVGGIALGFMFGMPQIAKWIPGDSPAEQKAQELSRKLAPFQVILGIICGGAGIVMLLIGLKIMSPF
ncbi:MAG: hypothetical protein SFX73_03350 [Kofleriaceae bacterium]|nr:hypothetical protein [Kofleriaceae bacterium]